jgi:exopolysaccharide biosynthesis polyprenyl glycosylphosphotransferase
METEAYELSNAIAESVHAYAPAQAVGLEAPATSLPPADPVPVLDPSPDRVGARLAASRRRSAIGRRAVALADCAALLGSLAFAAAVWPSASPRWTALLAVPLFVVVVQAVGLYDRDDHRLHKTTVDEVPMLFGLATVTTLLLWLGEGAIVTGAFAKGQILGLWAVLFVFLVGLRASARAITTAKQAPERCLVLGSPEDAELIANQIEISPSVRAEIVGVLPPLTGGRTGDRVELPARLGEVLVADRVDRVILARPPGALEGADSLLRAMRQLRSYGVRISLLPKGPRVAGPAVELDELSGINLLGIRGLNIRRSSRIIKRSFDVVLSGLAILVLSPIALAIAIAIKLSSPGPVLFRQRRVGRGGREFTMLKFRSMVSEAEQRKDELLHLNEGGPGLFKIAADPRVTGVGRFLRRSSIDELPQLWNVLVGEMSLVGPRPLVPEEDGRIEGWYRRRLEVRPGMTGHWQILHTSRRITLGEMAKLDYLYVANWTLWNDVRLLLRTLLFVIGARGV